jgi:hypothetical protein
MFSARQLSFYGHVTSLYSLPVQSTQTYLRLPFAGLGQFRRIANKILHAFSLPAEYLNFPLHFLNHGFSL